MSKEERLASEGRVKILRFYPSMKELYIVVGRMNEYVVNLDPPFCICEDFFFKLTQKKERKCVHIKALEIALRNKSCEVFILSDEEMDQIFKYLVLDLFKK